MSNKEKRKNAEKKCFVFGWKDKTVDEDWEVGDVKHYRPDKFYHNNPDRYFTTVGAISGPKQRPNVLVRPTHRRNTNKYHVGPATNVAGSKSI